MRLNKKIQYAVVLALYLSRAGRANLVSVASETKIPLTFLQQIANALKHAGILRAIKGPGGGYELVGSPSVGEVVAAISPFMFMSDGEWKFHATGSQESRALSKFMSELSVWMSPFLSRSISEVMYDLVASEVSILDKIKSDSTVN